MNVDDMVLFIGVSVLGYVVGYVIAESLKRR